MTTFVSIPAAGLNIETNELSSVTGVLAIINGGTNSSTVLQNGRVIVTSGDALVETAAITASRALVSSAGGLPTHSAVTSTELGYVSGVTSALQTQIDTKAATTAIATMPVWTKYSILHTALQTAATSNNIELFSLPAKSLIHKVIIKQTTAFAGCTTYTLSVGITGTLTKYIAAYDVAAAVAATTFGVSLATVNPTLENFSSATSIKVAATSTIDNLSSSSAGAADIYVLTSTLP